MRIFWLSRCATPVKVDRQDEQLVDGWTLCNDMVMQLKLDWQRSKLRTSCNHLTAETFKPRSSFTSRMDACDDDMLFMTSRPFSYYSLSDVIASNLRFSRRLNDHMGTLVAYLDTSHLHHVREMKFMKQSPWTLACCLFLREILFVLLWSESGRPSVAAMMISYNSKKPLS